jgi:ABC-type dipeptide/oligopeptide/nickel transport system permease component
LVCIPTVFLVITLVFFAFQLIPGDAALIFAGEQASQEQIAQIRSDLGQDKPVFEQYSIYLQRLLKGDMGKSAITGRPVFLEIKSRFFNTVRLAVVATVVSSIFGIVFGTISALKREKPADYVISVLSIFGISIPSFWLALLLMYFFSVKLKLLPTTGNASLKHYIMPTIVLSVYSIAFIARMTRSSLFEILGEDYVRTAREKGMKERIVIAKHVLRNALIPVITVVGLQFGYLLGGAVVTETVFAWPGLGRLLVTSVEQRDLMVVQGVLLVFATSFVLVNLLIDLLYGLVDPRIRFN